MTSKRRELPPEIVAAVTRVMTPELLEQITARLVEAAEAGNMQAIRLLLRYGLEERTGRRKRP
jgi:hypothetical protein